MKIVSIENFFASFPNYTTFSYSNWFSNISLFIFSDVVYLYSSQFFSESASN